MCIVQRSIGPYKNVSRTFPKFLDTREWETALPSLTTCMILLWGKEVARKPACDKCSGTCAVYACVSYFIKYSFI